MVLTMLLIFNKLELYIWGREIIRCFLVIWVLVTILQVIFGTTFLPIGYICKLITLKTS